MSLQAHTLNFGYENSKPVLNNISLSLNEGELVFIAGANGSGKSTLLKCLAGIHAKASGSVSASARVSYLPQSVHPSQPFTVRQTVELGARISDDSNIDDLLIALDIKHLSARTLTQLSGGEYQRALVASVLAERPRFLLLDEPSSSLDLHHQINLFKMLASIAADGLGIAVVCHDLNIASLFADKIYLLHHGCIAVSGKPCDVITQNNIDAVFGTGVSVNQIKNRPVVVPSDD